MNLKTTVTEKTEVISGKTYPVRITRSVGLQEFEANGEKFWISALTVTESALGRSVCWTRAPEVEPSEEERARNRKIVQEVATQCMIGQGIW